MSDVSGYKGVGFLASWDLNDSQYVQKLFAKIRLATRTKNYYMSRKLSEGFNDKLDRIWNDQTTDIEPLQVVKSHNKIVNDGLVRIAEMVTGQNPPQWTHIAIGTGGNRVSASDSFLQTELSRVGLGTDGFQSPAGSVMRYGGFYAPSVASGTIFEAAVFDDPTSGTMFFRTVYPNPITHVVNNDFLSVAHSIYQVSV